MDMGEPSSIKLNLGRIEYLNVLPIYYPLENGIIPHSFTIIRGVPSYLNGLAAKGQLDLSPVSSIEYAKNPSLYYIVPDLSISSHGKVLSVLLLSRKPVEQLSGKKIVVSSHSHTSVGLLKVLTRMRYKVDPEFEISAFPAENIKSGLPDAFLAIGDEALRLAASGLYPIALDLGAAWYEWTGLPFVFAIWVVRKKAVVGKNGQLGPALEALIESKKWGCSNIEHICEAAADAGVLNIEQLREYYRCLKYDLNEKERNGLELFYSCLSRIGELECAPKPEIYTPLASVA